MMSFAQFGNDLYTGKRSIDFVGRSRTWYLWSALIMVVAALGFVVQGLNLSLEFTGGSEFTISSVADDDPQVGQQALRFAVPLAGGAGEPGQEVLP